MTRKLFHFSQGIKPEMSFNVPKGSILWGVDVISRDQICFTYIGDPNEADKEMHTFFTLHPGGVIPNAPTAYPVGRLYIPAVDAYRFIFERLPDAAERGWLEKARL